MHTARSHSVRASAELGSLCVPIAGVRQFVLLLIECRSSDLHSNKRVCETIAVTHGTRRTHTSLPASFSAAAAARYAASTRSGGDTCARTHAAQVLSGYARVCAHAYSERKAIGVQDGRRVLARLTGVGGHRARRADLGIDALRTCITHDVL
jgi:hypothetical protein